ncbi:WhiB family transcriptional regulator [Streptomyces sp. NPDC007851]|uniref:WhiB family transcriptional regulator n=1 Tax=Streptomyces sp. NPDC007851 TaxID=3155008 RepID=UPI0033F5D00E
MDWVLRGLCRTQPERMFAEGTAQNDAKSVCAGCPVRLECLAHALDHREKHGVWGAMTERERRALLRSRPAVKSWAEIFRSARTREDTRLVDLPQPVVDHLDGAARETERHPDVGPAHSDR